MKGSDAPTSSRYTSRNGKMIYDRDEILYHQMNAEEKDLYDLTLSNLTFISNRLTESRNEIQFHDERSRAVRRNVSNILYYLDCDAELKDTVELLEKYEAKRDRIMMTNTNLGISKMKSDLAILRINKEFVREDVKANRTESSRSTKIKAEAAMKRKELYSKLDHQKKKVSDMQKQMSGAVWRQNTLKEKIERIERKRDDIKKILKKASRNLFFNEINVSEGNYLSQLQLKRLLRSSLIWHYVPYGSSSSYRDLFLNHVCVSEYEPSFCSQHFHLIMKECENGNVIENTIRTENDANYVHRDEEILDNHHSEIDSINYKNLYMLYMREWQCEIFFYCDGNCVVQTWYSTTTKNVGDEEFNTSPDL